MTYLSSRDNKNLAVLAFLLVVYCVLSEICSVYLQVSDVAKGIMNAIKMQKADGQTYEAVG